MLGRRKKHKREFDFVMTSGLCGTVLSSAQIALELLSPSLPDLVGLCGRRRCSKVVCNGDVWCWIASG